MTRDEIKQQISRLYETLPQELKDAYFSEEIGDITADVCDRNGAGKQVRGVAEHVGYTLLGILPPKDLQKSLEQDLGIKEEIAEKVSREINRLIFFPLKESLKNFFELKEIVGGETVGITGLKETAQETKVPKKDIYREPIE